MASMIPTAIATMTSRLSPTRTNVIIFAPDKLVVGKHFQVNLA
jgi:hypothetical protein